MIRQTEVDGIPTLIARTDGPMTAGLMFRVGMADETLPLCGITHLVEHLALHRHGLADYHYNGTTSATETHFLVQGSPEQVVAYLTGVCAGLTNLPLERLQTEKSILETEANGRSLNLLARVRHGARDYGLTGYPTWGLAQLRPEDVQGWASAWFTRGNAVLWIAGDDVPGGLRLHLPDGPRRPLPVPSQALPEGRAYLTTQTDSVTFDGLVGRGAAAMVYTEVLQRRLFRDLRLEGGYSYTVATGYERRGEHAAAVTAMADTHPDCYDAVIGATVDALASLAAGHVDEGDIASVKAQFRENHSLPDADAGRLPSMACELLAGRPVRTAADLLAEISAVEPAAVAATAARSWQNGLLKVRDGQEVEWTGFTGFSTHRAPVPPVSGAPRPARDDAERRLVLGSDGVSLQSPALTSTVRFDACAALLAWPDGARQAIGADGTTIAVEPTRFGLDAAAVGTLTAGVHPARVIWMPPRDPGEIPTEQSWGPAADDGRSGRGRGKGGRSPVGSGGPAGNGGPGGYGASAGVRPPGTPSLVGLIGLYVLAVPLSLFLLLMTLLSIGDPESDSALWVALVVTWFVPAFFWLGIVLLHRHRRRGRRWAG